MEEFHLRMQLAALKQYLRDRHHEMTQEELDKVLDLIARILEALEKSTP
jgi:1,2-phenylacetyl-CoA epoxidase catalytic subunit